MPFLPPNQQRQSTEGTKINQLVQENVHVIIKAHLSDNRVTNISKGFTHKMAVKISWHRYGTKLRDGHPMYNEVLRFSKPSCRYKRAFPCVLVHLATVVP